MKNKNIHQIAEILFLFLLSLTPLLWLQRDTIILGHDSGFRINPIQYLMQIFYSWNPTVGFGTDLSINKGFLITQLPEALFTFIFHSVRIGQEFTFVFWFFLMGISMYIFINNFFPQRKFWIFRLFSSIFYMYNFFLLQGWFIVERAKFSLFAALPLGFLILYKLLHKEYTFIKGTIIFSAIFFFLNGGGNPSLYGALILVYFITFLYITIINYLKYGVREIVFSLKVVSGLLLGVLLINAYWIFPQVYLAVNKYASMLSSVGGISGILTWEGVVNRYASFLNLFRLQGIPDWYNNAGHTYSSNFINSPLLIVSSFLPILVILSGLFLLKKFDEKERNDELFFLIFLLFLVGIVFTSGSHPPLGFLYSFFIAHVPGFAIFRSAFYKFGPSFWFSFIFLTGYCLNFLIHRLTNRRITVFFLGVGFILFILFYHYPYFTNSFFDWNIPFTTKLKLPRYVEEASGYLNNLPKDSRVLMLPQLDTNFHADSYEWGFWSLDLLPRLLSDSSIIANENNSSAVISEIYSQINLNNEFAFLRLTGLSGINKVLWRGDVLYTDKKTKSSSMTFSDVSLSHFRGLSLDKDFGKWKIYTISSPYYFPLFNVPERIIYAKSSESLIGDILNLSSDNKKTAVVFADSLTNKSRPPDFLPQENIVEADCILCDPGEFFEQGQNVVIPHVSLLPDSPFYFIVAFKEKKQHDNFKNYPVPLIDVDLGYSNKRLAEIKQLIERASIDDQKNVVNDDIARYITLIDEALSYANKLPEDTQNTVLIKIISYLRGQFRFLSLIEDRRGNFQDELENLGMFVNNLVNDLSRNKTRKSNVLEGLYEYSFDLAHDGTYDIHVSEEKGNSPAFVTVDHAPLRDLKNNYFSSGTHKLNIAYSSQTNYLNFNAASQSGKIDLGVGSDTKFVLKNINDQDTYSISFDYLITKGRPHLSIVEKKDGAFSSRRMQLEQNSVWNTFYYGLTPAMGDTDMYLKFYSSPLDQSGMGIEIKDLKVVKNFTPNVFLTSNQLSIAKQVPTISFQKINTTKYIVHIQNALKPYLLSFGENFSTGWKATIQNTRFSLPETDHFKINGYSNGWFIKQTGTYSILVEYYPQKIFYVGAIVTGISTFVMIFILVMLRRKNGEN